MRVALQLLSPSTSGASVERNANPGQPLTRDEGFAKVSAAELSALSFSSS